MRSGLGVILLGLICFSSLAFAVEPKERLADPVLEARARAISAKLRCLICQNESIDESHADLARDLRALVRERLTAGDTDAQAIQAIVDRFGDFVLLDPPVRPATYALWYGPPGLLLLASLTTILWLRRRGQSGEPAVPLSQAEQERIDALLLEDKR
jgi:cytochrome c-type biogenesis protein CcmH